MESGKVSNEAGQLHWPVTNEENAGRNYAKRFQAATIYKIKARKVLPNPQKKSTFKPYLNRYYVTEVLEAMRSFFTEQEKWDNEMRGYAAEKLTELANEWQEDEEETQECPEITEEEFAKRITICSVSMDDEGEFRVCFEDDNMFAGHNVVVYGSVEEGPDRANMEG